MVGPGSHRNIIWKGKCGHEWSAVIKNRVAGAGCPYCSHNKVLAGFNDLETLYPEVAKEWSDRNLPLLPSQVTAFANKKVWWKCSEGHEWFTLISTRSSGSKCPSDDAQNLVRRIQDYITQNLYTCTNKILRGLGKMSGGSAENTVMSGNQLLMPV